MTTAILSTLLLLVTVLAVLACAEIAKLREQIRGLEKRAKRAEDQSHLWAAYANRLRNWSTNRAAKGA